MYLPAGYKLKRESELASYGVRPEDFKSDDEGSLGMVDYAVWPENWPSYLVFSNMGTQWRVGMNGASGLDYNVLSEIWRRLKIPFNARDDIFQDIRLMESAALQQMNDNQPANAS